MTETGETDSRLYHYTTQQGLLGILENNCIWTTHYKFLNDYSEIIRFRKKLIQHLASKSFGVDRQNRENKCNPVIDDLYKFLTHEIYITSFCKGSDQNPSAHINLNGLLSQWRAYGEDGGFAIVFKKNELKKSLNIAEASFDFKTLFIGDVIYSDGREITHDTFYDIEKEPGTGVSCNDTQDYESAFSEQLDIIERFIFDEASKEEKESQLDEACLSFVKCVTCYKDYGFKEEREVRIVAMPAFQMFNKGKKREFRCKNGEQIPYIELFKPVKLSESNESIKSTLPIERIIVSPHKNKEARATWLCIKLAEMGRTDIIVNVSEIPFIGR